MLAAAIPAEDARPSRRFFNAGDDCWHVQLTLGETYVTSDGREILSTVLGSCIAACIRDPQAGVGGMNHFLLPDSGKSGGDALRYGVYAMEILINGLLKRGAVRSRLEAKLFGGASVIAGLSDVGASNVVFAEKFLADEGIRLVGGDVRGNRPRRIQYWPLTGRARQRAVAGNERLAERESLAARGDNGMEHDVELF